MWDTFAKMIGVPRRAAEDAIGSERAARATLSRRGLLLAGASALPALAVGRLFSDIDWHRTYQKFWVGQDKPWVGGVFDDPVLIEGDVPLFLSGGIFKKGVRIIAPTAHVTCMHVTGLLPDEDCAMKLEFRDNGGLVSSCSVELRNETGRTGDGFRVN